MLMKKAYEALPRGGALIVYEHLIDDERRSNIAGLLMSLTMLIETQGGFDYRRRLLRLDARGRLREKPMSSN
jgi:O-methyltransferase domain